MIVEENKFIVKEESCVLPKFLAFGYALAISNSGGAKKIYLADLTEAIDRVSIGPARKSKVISDKERKLVAYHEAGHAVVSYFMPEGKTVGKITIVSRGHAGGFTRYEQEAQSLMTNVELEAMIAQAEVIDVSQLSGDEIKFGANIKIIDDDTSEESVYQIVGEYESDVKNKKLSIFSPLARGLIGKKRDDVVEINSPKGLKTYTILSVKFK